MQVTMSLTEAALDASLSPQVSGLHGALAPAGSESESTMEALDATQDDSAEPCELDKPEYKTDEFRLYQFKIKPCCNEEAHDWCLCPFAHPGEKAQRRDPRLYKYTGVSCPDYRKGTCKRGNTCPYAHGVFEVWLHPSRYRTQTCKDAPHCTRQVCFFAHTLDEVRTVEPEDLPVLTDDASATAGVDNLDAACDSTAAAESVTLFPKCGSNTNAKAAAAAKAKAAAVASAAAKDGSSNSGSSASSVSGSSSGSSSSSGGAQGHGGLLDSWATGAGGKQHISRQASNCSTATTASQLTGLESLNSLSSALATPALSLLPSASPLVAQNAFLQAGVGSVGSMAGLTAAAAGGNRLLQVPMDIALEAAALRGAVAAAAAGGAQLCDTFGSLDLSGTAAAVAAAGAASPLDSFGAPSTAVGLGGWGAAAAAGSMGLPVPPMPAAGSFDAGVGQFATGGPLNNLAFAAAAHQAVAAQHRETQDLLQAVLLRQQQMTNMQQQHRDAMWAAAYDAAAGVGLNPVTAAACADAAVHSTTTAAAAAAAAPVVQAKQHQQLQQLLAAQQPQHHFSALPLTASAPMGVLPGGLAVGGFGLGAAATLPAVPPSLNLLEQQQIQQQLMPAGALMMQQANMLAAAQCDVFGAGKLGGLVGQVPGAMGPLQVSVTAGGAFGGLQ